MIKCPNCQAKSPENTLFCSECGAYLLRGEKKSTDPLLPVVEMTQMEREERSEVPGEEVTSPLVLKLTLPVSGRNVEVALTKEMSIGRMDPSTACFPDIDLSSYGALERGISRLHAKIIRRGNEVFIEDLGSMNGTFLNDEKLIPYLPRVLKGGDELRFGRLTLQVSFIR